MVHARRGEITALVSPRQLLFAARGPRWVHPGTPCPGCGRGGTPSSGSGPSDTPDRRGASPSERSGGLIPLTALSPCGPNLGRGVTHPPLPNPTRVHRDRLGTFLSCSPDPPLGLCLAPAQTLSLTLPLAYPNPNPLKRLHAKKYVQRQSVEEKCPQLLHRLQL